MTHMTARQATTAARRALLGVGIKHAMVRSVRDAVVDPTGAVRVAATTNVFGIDLTPEVRAALESIDGVSEVRDWESFIGVTF